jgi:hypothetical protein
MLSPTAASAISNGQLRRRFQPNKQNAAASIELGNKGIGSRLLNLTVLASVLMVSVVKALPAERLTV